MPQYELVYFKLKGRVELIRLFLVDQGIPFTDTFIDFSEWSSIKSNMPFGQVPILKVDGDQILSQSVTIARYLARENGLTPSDSWQQALCDMYMDQIEDVKKKFYNMIYNNYETGLDAFISEIPTLLTPFENRLGESGEFILSAGISLADYSLYDLLDTMNALKPGCLEETPTLNKYFKAFQSRPNIKSYRESETYKNMKYTGSKHL